VKVALVVPIFHYGEKQIQFLSVSDFPTGLAYLASSLKEAGHEVVGINLNNIMGYASHQDLLKELLTTEIRKHEPDLIGIGGLCTDYAFIRDTISVLRKRTDKPIVLGGGIVNNDAEYIFKLLKPDYAIVGEGEEAIVKLANKEENIPNLWYWKDGEATFTGQDYNYRPIDERPFPDYDPFNVRDMMDNYSMATRVLYRYSRPYPRPFVITTARGCPFSCTFCVHRGGPKYRARSVANVIKEITLMHDQYGFNILIMMDELFAVNKQRMRELCEAIIKGRKELGWDFDWMFQTHASANLDKETLELAKQAGCFFFSYGIESASPTVLKSMNKKAVPEQFVEAIKLAKETGIGFGGNLIFGDTAETEETMAESLSFWLTHCRSAFVFLSNVTPYPGSQLFDDAVKKGLIPDKYQYYETIDKNMYNLTSLSDVDMELRMKFIGTMEQSWTFVKNTFAHKIEVDNTDYDKLLMKYSGGNVYKITTKCPYCGEDSSYRNIMRDVKHPFFIGVGCTKCNQKIRVNVIAN
jgi:anaerobic magnesium-protoporphyrin IX monomethyl ester cyclase